MILLYYYVTHGEWSVSLSSSHPARTNFQIFSIYAAPPRETKTAGPEKWVITHRSRGCGFYDPLTTTFRNERLDLGEHYDFLSLVRLRNAAAVKMSQIAG